MIEAHGMRIIACRDNMVHFVLYDAHDRAFASIPASVDQATHTVSLIEGARFEIINGFESRTLH